MELESKFAMIFRKREERSNEPRPSEAMKINIVTQQMLNSYEPAKIATPNTTTNRQSSIETNKMLMLKQFQQVKKTSSTVVTPKNLKTKTGQPEKPVNQQEAS